MHHLKCYLILAGFVPVFNCHSQILIDNHYSKVVVEQGEEKLIGVDSIQIDTLVLKDDATLKFLQNSILTVENAFVGNNCNLQSSGLNGFDGKSTKTWDGGHGENGKNLTLIIDFKQLGSLAINTGGGRGGNGSAGRNGQSGLPGADGEDGQSGGNGGNGGDGGNLTLVYAHDGFIPVFNDNNRNHNIQLNYTGGEAGNAGLGGRGGRGGSAPTRTDYVNGTKVIVREGPQGKDGWKGSNGSHGKPGKDGELILNRSN